MPPQHGPRRAQIAFSDVAAKQVEATTSGARLHALDRALVVISVDPEAAELIPGAPKGPRLREYTDVIERRAPALLEERSGYRLYLGSMWPRCSSGLCCCVRHVSDGPASNKVTVCLRVLISRFCRLVIK